MKQILFFICIGLAGCAPATKKENAAPNPAVFKQPEPPAPIGKGLYVVKRGDTGAIIASEQNVSLSDLASLNPGVNWGRLAVGQTIRVQPDKK